MLIRNYPGYRVFISPESILGIILPRIKGFTLGGNFVFDEKHERGCPLTFIQSIVLHILTTLPKAFKQVGWDVVSAVSVWPTVTTMLFVADAGLIKVK